MDQIITKINIKICTAKETYLARFFSIEHWQTEI